MFVGTLRLSAHTDIKSGHMKIINKNTQV